MTKNEDHDRELLLKQLIQHSIDRQLDELKDNNKDSNSSFAYLDNKTLNMLLMYLLMYLDEPNNKAISARNNDFVSQEFMDEIDEMAAQQKEGFEEVLALLKEKT